MRLWKLKPTKKALQHALSVSAGPNTLKIVEFVHSEGWEVVDFFGRAVPLDETEHNVGLKIAGKRSHDLGLFND